MDNILSLVVMLVVFEGLIIVGLVVLVLYLMQTKNQNDIHKEIYDAGLIQVRAVFEEELKELAAKYAEELAALKFFEECDNVDIDLKYISEETQKRVLALNLKKAESAIVLCENNLSEIRSSIAVYQKKVADGRSSYRTDVLDMKTQENFAMKHLEEAQTRLSKLSELEQFA